MVFDYKYLLLIVFLLSLSAGAAVRYSTNSPLSVKDIILNRLTADEEREILSDPSFLNVATTDLELADKASKALKGAGLDQIGDLMPIRVVDLERMPNFGWGSVEKLLQEVQRVLRNTVQARSPVVRTQNALDHATSSLAVLVELAEALGMDISSLQGIEDFKALIRRCQGIFNSVPSVTED